MGDGVAIEVRTASRGRGVFAAAEIAGGASIFAFKGPRHPRAFVERTAERGGHDGFLQVDRDAFIGLSGAADDYVNHACRPNCFVLYRDDAITLRALREIGPGEELTFDYGLTQIAFPFRFTCRCKAARCRREIGNCDEIPPDVIAPYRRAGILPHYVEAYLANQECTA